MKYKEDPKAKQRLAIDKAISLAAAKGCPIAGATESLLHLASQHPATKYVMDTAHTHSDEELDADEDFPIF